MKYSTKVFLLFLCTSLLFSQENNESYRVGVDHKSKVKLSNDDATTINVVQNIIESAFSSTINKTIQNNWTLQFDKIAKSKIDEVLAEQKEREDFSECVDTKCAIRLGEILDAKYMIYRDIISIPGKIQRTQINFQLINIETSALEGAANVIYKGDLFSEAADKAFNDTMIRLFNDAFPNEIPIPVSRKSAITENPTNINAPTVDNLNIRTPHSRPKTIRLSGEDKDGDNVSFSIYTEPKHGSYQLRGSLLIYNPEKKYIGEDIIRYRATDGLLDSNVGVINIRITNNTPSSKDQEIIINENQITQIILSGSDRDKDVLSYEVTYGPINRGKLTSRGLGVYNYTPPKDFTGRDYFEFKVSDGIASSQAASVSIKINETYKKPVNTKKNVSESDEEEGGSNMLMIVGGLLLLVLLGAAGGGGGDSGPAPTGGVDIGIDIP